MNFDEIIGQDFLKKYFKKIIEQNKIPGAQLFVGDSGAGTLPMAWAFANELLCKNNPQCEGKVSKIIHPDLFFIFPSITGSSGSNTESQQLLPQFREFLRTSPYGSYYHWLQYLNAENKQGMIRVKDAENIIKKTFVKPYEGDYKVFIIWMAEKMNNETNNKLLKILEEPPTDTKFILIAENTENILPTVLSRCQIHYFNPIPASTIQNKLIELGVEEKKALKIAKQSNGSWTKALEILNKNESEETFQKDFVEWVRTAFMAKKKKSSVHQLINWSEKMASKGREEQKYFLSFVLEIFRQAMMINYGNQQLQYIDMSAVNFDINKLAPFIHNNNIEDIFKLIEKASYSIERNANAKLVFMNLSLSLTKLIHKKELL
jgi:DNA polymerase-3 subunit delta'